MVRPFPPRVTKRPRCGRSQFLAGVGRILYNRPSVGGSFKISKPYSEVCHDRKGGKPLGGFFQRREGRNRGGGGCGKGGGRGVWGREARLGRPDQVGSWPLVGGWHQAWGGLVRPRSHGGLSGMPCAADA